MQSATGNGDTLIWNFRQLAHHSLDGFGGMGEGMSMQLTKDGRRILWMAHESAPKNYTAVDVTDPKTLKIVARADLPHNRMRSNSLETVGDILAIAYQTQQTGDPEAGVELLDISTPENPKRIAFFDRSGPELARRASAMVRRRRLHPYEFRIARFEADRPEGRPVLSVHRREEPVKAGRDRAAGGCPARRKATTKRRRCGIPAAASIAASGRTTQTFIRSGRTGSTWAISTAA